MGNNILQPIPMTLNNYLLQNGQTVLSNTVPAAPEGATNVTWQFDQFGNISAYTEGGGGGGTASGPVNSIQTTDGDGNFTAVPNLLAEQIPSSTYASVTLSGNNANGLRLGFVASPADPNFYFDTLSEGNFQFRIGGTSPVVTIASGAVEISQSAITLTDAGTPTFADSNIGAIWFSQGSNAIELFSSSNLGTGQSGGYLAFNSSNGVDTPTQTFFTNSTGFTLNVGLFLNGNSTSTSATAGGASALPATPAGYLDIQINGTNAKIPYYAN